MLILSRQKSKVKILSSIRGLGCGSKREGMVAREGQNWDGDEVHMVKANHTRAIGSEGVNQPWNPSSVTTACVPEV